MRVGSNETSLGTKSLTEHGRRPNRLKHLKANLGDAIRLVRQRTNNFESSIDAVSAAIAITSELKKCSERIRNITFTAAATP